MVLVIVMMAVILALCCVIVAYVAFPHRGEELPVAPWIGDAMSRAADVLPVLKDEQRGVDERFPYADHQ